VCVVSCSVCLGVCVVNVQCVHVVSLLVSVCTWLAWLACVYKVRLVR
jgi:hypothetical protein